MFPMFYSIPVALPPITCSVAVTGVGTRSSTQILIFVSVSKTVRVCSTKAMTGSGGTASEP